MTERRVVEVEKVVRLIVDALMDDPGQALIMPVERDGGVHFLVTAPGDQLGKLVGSNGRTARSIRTILGLVSVKNKELYTVEIQAMHED